MEADDMSKPPPEPRTIADEKLRQYAQFLYERQAWTEERIEQGKRREHMLAEAIQSERRERELERAMWKDIVALLRRATTTAEQDTAAIQTVLNTAGAIVSNHLPFWLNWIWTRSSSAEIVDHRGSRDALAQLVGMLQPFANHDTEE